MEILEPRDAIGAWQRQEITGTALLRHLVFHAQWSIPMSEAAVGETLATGGVSRVMTSKDPDGVTRLLIFSDEEAYRHYGQTTGEPRAPGQHFLTTTGGWVFRLPLEQVDFITIDPYSPHMVSYGKELFPRLRDMADALEVEAALQELRASAAPREGLISVIKSYAAYSLIVHKLGEEKVLALAPDERNRTLAAVFTFDDALDAYSGEAREMYPQGELIQVPATGELLFRQLLTMELDGIVFNCSGPSRPVAFAPGFARIVLEAG
jgi:hypothetical protein